MRRRWHKRTPHPKHRCQVRLFWVILRMFILVIVLGIGGMLIFFRIAVEDSERSWEERREAHQRSTTHQEILVNYYIAHGNSWEGIDEFLENLSWDMQPHPLAFTIVDQDGYVVATTNGRWQVGQMLDNGVRKHGRPIHTHDKHIGTLLLWEWDFEGPPGRDNHRSPPPPEFVQSFFKGLIAAGVGLCVILMTLAVLSASNLTRPLHSLTDAAQHMAAGNLDIQVPGSRVRELNDLADAFNRMAKALADADCQRKQMTADVAHELRTPLAIVKGRLEGLQDGVYQATPEQIGRLLNEIALIERLIEDLRLLALADAGQLQLYPEPLSPRDVLEDIAAAFADQAAARSIDLCVDAPEHLPMVNIDAQRMAQVLTNLMSNALRHTPDGGVITLTGEGEQNGFPGAAARVVLRVRDSGQGIAPEDLPQIFDRFWRADRSRTRSSGGTGLGLAIAQKIVAAHGGTIQAESTPGQGTTMSIALPCGEE